ncbi:MAG: LURP-one-related family protein [Candidatus Lokiarchaeota archaeon]|nr:LURP-one-related family protein [Candidatus Lokiarchaeota archaeon]
MKCPNCGDPANEDQKFCEKCGSEIRAVQSPPEKKEPINLTSAPKQTPLEGTGLLDLSRNYFILKEKLWDWGSGPIYDENHQEIGRMKRIILSIRRRVELQELDGTVVATIHSKIVSARGAQDLKTPDGELIARIKKKILTFFKSKFFLEDPLGTRWFEAEGDFFGWSFKIYDLTTGKLVAEIEKADKWRDVFLGGLFDFADTYALKILDNETDRRILLGFVLSIDNVMHDSGGMGPMMGGMGPRRRGPFGMPRRR